MLVKIDFFTFSISFGETILKNNGVQIFTTLGDFLLLWQPKALSNKLSAPITKMLNI